MVQKAKRPWRRIRFVDGFRIRNVFPDFDLVEPCLTSGYRVGEMATPFIPSGEVWVDRWFRKEASFLLKVHSIEQRYRQHWSLAKIRKHLARTLTKKGPPPPFVVRTERRGRLTIRYVRGEIVRRYFDPEFVFGRHDLVCRYIPPREVWIDVRQDPREVHYTLGHELFERRLMERGFSYNRAHARATTRERSLRRREFAPRTQPSLRLKPFRETPGFCGPASLKIVLDYVGRDYDERRLAEFCSANNETGTEHAGLIAGAKAVGASVFEKAGGTIAELRWFIEHERLPVLVGWWSGPAREREEVLNNPKKDAGHFSVVYRVSDQYVYLMDPETKIGRRRLTIPRFLAKWWDLDTPQYVKVSLWYLVVNFEGRKFDFPDGKNH